MEVVLIHEKDCSHDGALCKTRENKCGAFIEMRYENNTLLETRRDKEFQKIMTSGKISGIACLPKKSRKNNRSFMRHIVSAHNAPFLPLWRPGTRLPCVATISTVRDRTFKRRIDIVLRYKALPNLERVFW